MATIPTGFFWSSSHQTAYNEACPGLFLNAGKPSKLIALEESQRECMSTVHSPALTEDSATTKIESEKPDLTEEQTDKNTDLKHMVIKNDHEFECYHQNATGDRKLVIQHNDHSWSRLNVTKSLFDCLCFHFQISDALKYMITYFGEKSRCDEVRPPLPQCQITPDDQGHYSLETCYTLRYIALNQNGDADNPWSLRQFAVHARQRDTDYSSWLLIAPPQEVIPCIASPPSEALNNIPVGFGLHIVLIEHAVACWRPYLYYLMEEVDKCNEQLAFAAPPAAMKVNLAILRLQLKNLEDQVEDAKVSLQSNEAVIRTIKQLCLKQSCAHETSRINPPEGSSHIGEKCSNYLLVSEAMISQLQSLRKKILSCTEITSSFSELANGQALQGLARSANSEAQRASSDAAAMKALTVIASIFLPTTVVLNFFSASFINVTGNQMHLADKWWLFVAISGPLTVLTLVFWTLWMRYQRWKSNMSNGNLGGLQDPNEMV